MKRLLNFLAQVPEIRYDCAPRRRPWAFVLRSLDPWSVPRAIIPRTWPPAFGSRYLVRAFGRRYLVRAFGRRYLVRAFGRRYLVRAFGRRYLVRAFGRRYLVRAFGRRYLVRAFGRRYLVRASGFGPPSPGPGFASGQPGLGGSRELRTVQGEVTCWQIMHHIGLFEKALGCWPSFRAPARLSVPCRAAGTASKQGWPVASGPSGRSSRPAGATGTRQLNLAPGGSAESGGPPTLLPGGRPR
jgi:hypothetical protein